MFYFIPKIECFCLIMSLFLKFSYVRFFYTVEILSLSSVIDIQNRLLKPLDDKSWEIHFLVCISLPEISTQIA